MSARTWRSASTSVVASDRLKSALPFFTLYDEWVASAPAGPSAAR